MFLLRVGLLYTVLVYQEKLQNKLPRRKHRVLNHVWKIFRQRLHINNVV